MNKSISNIIFKDMDEPNVRLKQCYKDNVNFVLIHLIVYQYKIVLFSNIILLLLCIYFLINIVHLSCEHINSKPVTQTQKGINGQGHAANT